MNGPNDVAAYIGPICAEMRKLAVNADLAFLAYLLEMSALEAAKIESQTRLEISQRPHVGGKPALV
ncbi:hypothetical protein [Afipia sp. P52-10]|jgi:capsule polysaccharide export protein KpsE/RkpR|uniref:hypothetical protein n=1 Tax=Afipia sp. P52-10 TaxID=1429916 RepID=UPI0012691495|nr:hypothetical protein [Afipia sp. P52-10]